MADVYEDVSEAIGGTPMVRLRRSVKTTGRGIEVFAKLEYLNPMGSVKDRVARYLVDRALASGTLSPGGLVIEASSGNTAMGLAMMATNRGLRCRAVVRRQTSREKLDCLRALGVELVLVDGDLPPEHPESYNRKARSLVAACPDAFFPDQHNNRENNQCHYEMTAPEIWRQMDGRIDVFVGGIGTGGTVSGVGRYLKERDPKIEVVAVDVEGSVFSRHFAALSGSDDDSAPPGRYLLEGLGDEEIIDCPEFEVFDRMLQVSDSEAFLTARELARDEAMLVGGSSGAALWGVREILPGLQPGARVVTLFPDSGTRYLSTIYNDDWLREQGLPTARE
ncbi:MAG: cysteine synthase family protein [Acidobacteria bacterium]|nr:cysteine synthase family protein [Acidobacteriota bacterium]